MVALNNHSWNHNDPVLESSTLQAEPGLRSSVYVTVNGIVHIYFVSGNMTLSAVSVENTTICVEWPRPASKMLITAKSEYAEVQPIHVGDYNCDAAVNSE